MAEMHLPRVSVFWGEMSPQLAHVYVRIDGLDAQDDVYLSGTVRGPESALTRTLPATVPLADLGAVPSHLARAIVPDPCFWAPGTPYLYGLDLQLCRDRQVLGRASRQFGLRRLGTAGRRLQWGTEPWVLRAAAAAGISPAELAAWRESEMACLMERPADAFCLAAAHEGVVVVADLRNVDVGQIATELERLAQWASVPIVILPTGPDAADHWQQRAPNLLLAQSFDEGQPIEPASGIPLVVCRAGDAGAWPEQISDCPVPVLAWRPSSSGGSPDAAHRRCQQLEHDLTALGTLAGYIT